MGSVTKDLEIIIVGGGIGGLAAVSPTMHFFQEISSNE
jgi:hypothetical protein